MNCNTGDKKMCCPITGAYIPRLLLCVVVGFFFIFGFDFILHTKILMQRYEETASLWRTEEDMQKNFGFLLFAQFMTVFASAVIYSKLHKGGCGNCGNGNCKNGNCGGKKGICGGVCYGLFLGLLLGTLMAAPYSWMPIPEDLARAWFIGGLLQGIGLGIIYSILYKSPSSSGGGCDTKDTKNSCETENKDKKTGCCG